MQHAVAYFRFICSENGEETVGLQAKEVETANLLAAHPESTQQQETLDSMGFEAWLVTTFSRSVHAQDRSVSVHCEAPDRRIWIQRALSEIPQGLT